MKINFYISGSRVATVTNSMAPTIGSEVTIITDSYKKGMWPGTILNFRVSEDFPPHFDYTSDEVMIDVADWNVFKEGPVPEGERGDEY